MAARRLIVCFDGTWNKTHPRGGDSPTNIVKLSRALGARGSDGIDQLTLYLDGVGARGWVDYFVGGYTGHGLGGRVLDAFQWLANNWRAGDSICLFGFSRGALAARSLATLLGERGLLAPSRLAQLPKLWADLVEGREGELAGEPVEIELLCAWDSVAALGLPVPGLRRLTRPQIPYDEGRLGAHVLTAIQALAIDEIRSMFRPLMWTNDPEPGQRIEQVWFSGAHADCGGGYPQPGLSDHCLAWMIGRARTSGLAFEQSYIDACIKPNLLQAPRFDRSGLHLLLPVHHRPLLAANPRTESIHPSAVERFRDPHAGYQPANLAAALDVHGDSCLESPSNRAVV